MICCFSPEDCPLHTTHPSMSPLWIYLSLLMYKCQALHCFSPSINMACWSQKPLLLRYRFALHSLPIINCPFCLSNLCFALLLISFPLFSHLHLLLEPHLNKMSWEFCYSVYRTGHVQALTRCAYPSSSLSPPFS